MKKKPAPASTSLLSKVETHSVQDRVYWQLRDILMRGGFAPGEKLSSRKLAASLGTSDMPARAALGRLLAEQALVQNSNGTFSVPLISLRKFQEVMEARALLESRATELACGLIDDAGFAELHDAAAGLDRAISENVIEDYLDHNQRLKFTVYRYCPSETLQSLIRLMWLQAGPFLRHLNKGLDRMIEANFHDEAIEALSSGDGAAAGEAISRDILAGMAFLSTHGEFVEELPTLRPSATGLN
ncbi:MULTISPECIES: GntR family transcriptional regulator [Roseovarius]|uniref:GntR family transcriptional regulator n=1 Tax=Roseovarius TaxID=74030 RepID=UPI001C97D3D7|nr:GntR family transcriptional regulator [Roseovarius atlanticus]MBY5989097.1 GntR family transcriptional regulator [Roseovarius atlanticus]MBY6124489.1 GntR family transcriptional regulator [Roseovarius atlanticus]MBY6148984.1 GntR family transcriptional regulator [Roseovarius atlanticus]